jgi:arginase
MTIEGPTMRIQIIANPCIEAAGDTSSFPVARRHTGIAQASDAILEAGLVDDLSNRGVEVAGSSRVELAPGEQTADSIADLGLHGAKLAAELSSAIDAGVQPLLVGGTCNHVSGILSGLQQAYGPGSRIGIVWFDSHGDLNTPKTSGSGMIWGMPLAVALGLCYPQWREGAGMGAPIPTNRVVFVDVRNLDPPEAALIDATDLVLSHTVDSRTGPRAADAIADLADRVDHIYVHVDLDVLDPRFVPSLPITEPDGPDLDQATAAIRAAMRTGKVRAYGVVSFDPTGPGGETSLNSARMLILGGIDAWTSAPVL